MKEPTELSVEECLDLLAGEVFGRLAVVTPAGPRIIPVNYLLLDDAVALRTSPSSELARNAIGEEVAFEIDDVDNGRQTGWSVMLVGRLELVDPADLADPRRVWVPQPWAGGRRNLCLQLRWREVSGRRLRDAPATTVPTRRAL